MLKYSTQLSLPFVLTLLGRLSRLTVDQISVVLTKVDSNENTTLLGSGLGYWARVRVLGEG